MKRLTIPAESMALIIAFYVSYKQDVSAAAEALKWWAETQSRRKND